MNTMEMGDMMQYSIGDMFPDELDLRLQEGRGTAIIPIGSVEQHGPHLLLGCDSYVAMAIADLTAKKSDGVLFPLIPYSWVGGLRAWPGTIDMRSENTGDYLEEVCLNILEMGFKKLLLINCHGGGREMVFSVADRVFRKSGIPVMSMYPLNLYVEYPEIYKAWESYGIGKDWGTYEASKMVGALKYFRQNELKQKVEGCISEMLIEFGENHVSIELPFLKKLFELGEVGHDYLYELQHVKPRKNTNLEAGIHIMEIMAEKLTEAIELLDKYQEHINKGWLCND